MSVCFFVPTEQAGGSGDDGAEGDVGSPEAPESNAAECTNMVMQQFWDKVAEDVRKVSPDDFKTQTLPLARIKKIMKLDEDVKMISAEAPVLFARAAEIFIHELTLRAWVHTEDNKRRTLQRNDIAMAISKSDQFDFLIDIVPRHEMKPLPRREEPPKTSTATDQGQYYLQLAQQHQAALQSPQQQLILQPQIHSVQSSTGGGGGGGGGGGAGAVGVTPQPVHIVQQIVPSNDLPQIHLTPSQMSLLRMQMQNNSGQPVIIQAQGQQQPQIIQVQQSQQQPQPTQQVFLTQVATSHDGD